MSYYKGSPDAPKPQPYAPLPNRWAVSKERIAELRAECLTQRLAWLDNHPRGLNTGLHNLLEVFGWPSERRASVGVGGAPKTESCKA